VTNFNDFVSGNLSDYVSLSTRTFFEQQRDELEAELKKEAEKKEAYKDFRKRSIAIAIELEILDELEAEFLQTVTICSLIREYKKSSK
jgi:hypothetical protein